MMLKVLKNWCDCSQLALNSSSTILCKSKTVIAKFLGLIDGFLTIEHSVPFYHMYVVLVAINTIHLARLIIVHSSMVDDSIITMVFCYVSCIKLTQHIRLLLMYK